MEGYRNNTVKTVRYMDDVPSCSDRLIVYKAGKELLLNEMGDFNFVFKKLYEADEFEVLTHERQIGGNLGMTNGWTTFYLIFDGS